MRLVRRASFNVAASLVRIRGEIEVGPQRDDDPFNEALIVLVVNFIAFRQLLSLDTDPRYDGLIERQENIYRIDPDLVWSIITRRHTSSLEDCKDGEKIDAVTPGWAPKGGETGMRELERKMPGTFQPAAYKEKRSMVLVPGKFYDIQR